MAGTYIKYFRVENFSGGTSGDPLNANPGTGKKATLRIYNAGPGVAYLGESNVTVTTGHALAPGDSFVTEVYGNDEVYYLAAHTNGPVTVFAIQSGTYSV